MENKTYQFIVGGQKISVTSEETISYYSSRYNLTEKEIEEFAARYVAQIKYYRECPKWLDKELVRRLLAEEFLMKERESDGFKLQLTFAWYAELKKERIDSCMYTVRAYCLDNLQCIGRRYLTLSDALLDCVNGFNENAALSNRYKSVEHYLASE